MFADLYNVLLLVVQVLALVWGIGLALRFIFGFGLDSEGQIVTSNRRGKFISNCFDRVAFFARKARGKTHDTKVKVVMGKAKDTQDREAV